LSAENPRIQLVRAPTRSEFQAHLLCGFRILGFSYLLLFPTSQGYHNGSRPQRTKEPSHAADEIHCIRHLRGTLRRTRQVLPEFLIGVLIFIATWYVPYKWRYAPDFDPKWTGFDEAFGNELADRLSSMWVIKFSTEAPGSINLAHLRQIVKRHLHPSEGYVETVGCPAQEGQEAQDWILIITSASDLHMDVSSLARAIASELSLSNLAIWHNQQTTWVSPIESI
jgi:hypothetical protein